VNNYDELRPNSPDLNPLGYKVWGAILARYKTFKPKPNTIDELKKVLQTIWDDCKDVTTPIHILALYM